MRGAVLVALLTTAGGAHAKPAAVPSIILPDPLAEAREAWRAGNRPRAWEIVDEGTTPAHFLMGGLLALDEANDAKAVLSLEKVPPQSVLADVAQPLLVGAYRRIGRIDDAKSLAKALVKRKLPGALHIAADVEAATRGCKGIDAHRTALKKEPGAHGRHATRRMVLLCSTDANEKVRLALAMLDDVEPVDSELAKKTLDGVVGNELKKLRLSFEFALRLVEKLFAEALPERAGQVLSVIKEPTDPTDRTRLRLFQAQFLATQGKREERLALLEKARKDGAGTLGPSLEKILLEAKQSAMKPEDIAAEYLRIADAYPTDPVSSESRHLGAYHLAEAGKLKEAIEQWDVVATQPGPKRRDAAWFATQKTALLGDFAGASRRAAAMSSREGDSQWAALLSYWSARWLLDAGEADDAMAAFKAVCARHPSRIHGRFACARAQMTAAIPGDAAPNIDDAFVLLLALHQSKGLPSSTKAAVERATAYAQAGAAAAARAQLRSVAGILAGLPSELALTYGEAALSLDDAQQAVILAERRRAEVDRMDNARWVRLAYPRLTHLSDAAGKEQIDEDLVHAIARTESWFSSSVRSRVGAIGLMQIMPKTGAELAARPPPVNLDEDSLWNPLTNALLGSRYLRMLQGDFGARVELVSAAYNAGPKATRKFVERGRGLPLDAFLEAINFRETRGYARRVLEATLVYRALRGVPSVVDPGQVMDVTPGEGVQF